VEQQLLLGALQRIWQGLEHLYAFGEMANRLLMRRVLRRPLPSQQPIAHGLHTEAGLCVMMGHQLRLSVGDLGKPRL